jgi:TolB protein
MRLVALIALAVVPTLLPAAPVPKAGPPRLIVASSHKDGLWGIYVVHPDTGESKRLTDPRKACYGATWAPDGKRIAFGCHSGIWTMNADGTDARQLTEGGGERQWSPDGKRFAFMLKDGKERIHIADVATGKLTQLTDGSVPHGQLAWSPDGKRLLYATRGGQGEVHTISADGTDDQKVTDTNGGWEAAWSPDGKRITYTAFLSAPAPGWRVFTVGADGKGRKQLTTGANADGNVFPQWSPDGNLIAFTDLVDGVFQLGVVSAAGGETKIITSGPLAHSCPKWSPDGKSLCYLRTEKAKRPELVVSDPDGANAKVVLTHVGDTVEWLPK